MEDAGQVSRVSSPVMDHGQYRAPQSKERASEIVNEGQPNRQNIGNMTPSLPSMSHLLPLDPSRSTGKAEGSIVRLQGSEREYESRRATDSFSRESRPESSRSGALRQVYPMRPSIDRLSSTETRRQIVGNYKAQAIPTQRLHNRSEHHLTLTPEDHNVLDTLRQELLRASDYIGEITSSRVRPNGEQWNIARDVIGRLTAVMEGRAQQWDADASIVRSESHDPGHHLPLSATPGHINEDLQFGQLRRYSVGDQLHMGREAYNEDPESQSRQPTTGTSRQLIPPPHFSPFSRPPNAPSRQDMSYTMSNSSSVQESSYPRSEQDGFMHSPSSYHSTDPFFRSRRPSSLSMGAVAPAGEAFFSAMPPRKAARRNTTTAPSPSARIGFGPPLLSASPSQALPNVRGRQHSGHPYSSDGKSGSESSGHQVYRSTSPGADDALHSSQKYRKRSRAPGPGSCLSCGAQDTPEWRRGPDGLRTLCNACGLHFSKLVRRKRQRRSGSSHISSTETPESSAADQQASVTIEELRESLRVPQ